MSESDESSVNSFSVGTTNDLGTSTGSRSNYFEQRDYAGSKDAKTAMDEVKAIAEKETKKLRFWKFFVVGSILVTGALVSFGVFKILSKQQEDDIRNQFFLHANSMAKETGLHFEQVNTAMTDLAEQITAFAQMTNQTFPFVTVPLFEVIGRHAREQSGLEMLAFCPFIDNDQDLAEWGMYSTQNKDWLELSRTELINHLPETSPLPTNDEGSPLPFVFQITSEDDIGPVPPGRESYLPSWQFSPPPFSPMVLNFDLLTDPYFGNVFEAMKEKLDGPTYGRVRNSTLYRGFAISNEDHIKHHEQYSENVPGGTPADHGPHAFLVAPVYLHLDHSTREDIAGVIVGTLPFDSFLGNLLPVGVTGFKVILHNSCGQNFQYHLNGGKARYIGPIDIDYDAVVDLEAQVSVQFSHDHQHDHHSDVNASIEHCEYMFHIRAMETYGDDYRDNLPIAFSLLAASVFVLIALSFLYYDLFVRRRNTKIVDAAARTNAIVLSLFPKQVRDKLLFKAEKTGSGKARTEKKLKGFLQSGELPNEADTETGSNKSKPIAELFPETTVMFADLVGFTAWSSSRNPTQVFQLLEAIYGNFDRAASRRGVFKVETIGDCYVAVAGLPEPRKDHAIVMARFARDCIHQCHETVKKLVPELGPDTTELTLRIGLHSGQCTAGVLRGDRARFQLFGDTVNTAARMESTGLPRTIHVSSDTAALITEHGKESWITKRQDMVEAKGKGKLQTYFVSLSDHGPVGSAASSNDSFETPEDPLLSTISYEKTSNYVKWNVEVLARLLKEIVAERAASPKASGTPTQLLGNHSNGTPLDEVVDIVKLPSPKQSSTARDIESIQLDETVVQQLHQFVSNIAAMYRHNEFHNFEHASAVVMSVTKLQSRIVPDSDNDGHDKTHGIASNALVRFAMVFAALCHDVDHTGLPNTQLVNEQTTLARHYRGKSVAEQNSIDLSWNLLLHCDFAELRQCICADSPQDWALFRQVFVNAIMATDILDKDLGAIRKARWNKAFANGASKSSTSISIHHHQDDDPRVVSNRKATIILEHLIQASDVAHTMQHWHLYRKWNERLFREMHQAYQNGQSQRNPADFWYQGELGFFDFYIIPLAKNLQACGAFGVSSDEYLNYALKNRAEWEIRGRDVVAEMVQSILQTS